MSTTWRGINGATGVVSVLLGVFGEEFHGFKSSQRVPTWAGRIVFCAVGLYFILAALGWL
jgi:hypothetical protein